ncbi:dihydrofolate reductase [Herbihabitans rhizosphaerae]|uniref:Dihydrofolate reductase n=1 Tax=Herbihabitans rhizosphaerae TaxID=1872711 RepID=A0A4Q7KI26_9PSEU|nr:dihydrofolate reductase family protein [Herbihabitans rhizosphaerae]RZS34819.1 dihydrofolate reductase [Herbihabitans rhizosphaerae]
MRKVVLQELVSVDGFAAESDGELGFFEAIRDYRELDRDNVEFLERFDTVLLGATTYRMFVEYWPSQTAADEPVADRVNTIGKVVFSSTLDSAPWGSWEPARLVRGRAEDEVAALKQVDGGDMIVWGSLSLGRSLLAARLVDEVQLIVAPIVLGSGVRPFPESTIGLELVEVKQYEAGAASLRYQVR